MTDHDHKEPVPGCYRCDLGRDEERESLMAELDALRARVAVLERVRAAAEVAMSDLLPMVRGAKHFVTVRELLAAIDAAKETP